MKYRSSLILTIFALFVAVVHCFGQTGQVDPTFAASAYGQVNGPVSVIKKQPDGRYLIGGTFTEVQGRAASGIARLNIDLTVDTSFNPPDFGNNTVGLGGSVYAIGIQSDGKILVGGFIDFGIPGDSSRGIKRLNIDGSPDVTFSMPSFLYASVYDIVIQPDDKILVGGAFVLNNMGPFNFIRLTPNGLLDPSFTQSADGGGVYDIQLLSDGKIFVGGDGTGVLRRRNSDGTVDPSFAAVTTNGTIKAIRVQPDGNLIIAGGFTTVNSFTQRGIARINTDGTLDLTFNQNNPGPSGSINDVELLADGKIIIGGQFSSYNGTPRQQIARLNGDGTLDLTFQNTSLLALVNDIEPLPDGTFLAGSAGTGSPDSARTLLRFGVGGAIDYSIIVSRPGRVRAIAIQPDNKILIAGEFSSVNGFLRISLARLNVDGSIDQAFVPYFTTYKIITSIALQPDGKILVGSSLSDFVRLNPDGSRDTGFSSSLTYVNSIEVLPNGQIIASGFLSGSLIIARLNSTGSIDGSFTAPRPNDQVYKLRRQQDGKILIAGNFTQMGATVRGRVARLNNDGTLDSSFNPPGGANAIVYDIDLQTDGKVVLAGAFTGINGSTSQQMVGRLNSDGTLDSSFSQTTNSPLLAVVVQPDGKILIGGGMGVVGNMSHRGIARLLPDGNVDSSFNTFTNTTVWEIALQQDSKILVGGEFTRVNGLSSVEIARLLNNTVPPRTAFDFDGDGRADLSVTRPNGYVWYQLLGPNYTFSQSQFGQTGDVVTPADFDGDGITDIAIFRAPSGDWWYRSSITGQQLSVHWGANGDIPLPGDIDGDGRADFVVYRNGTWYRLVNGQSTQLNVAFGAAGDKPLLADFDGDGKADPAIFRPSSGTFWYAASTAGGAHRATQWGISTDVPVPADYDGDGKSDFAVYRPAEGAWYVLQSSNGQFIGLQFGVSEDRPIPADYDGDGKADIAVYRPSTGIWYLLRSTSGFGAFQWGISTDIPSPAAYIP